MSKRIAAHNGGAQIRSPLEHHPSRPVTVARGHVHRTGRLQSLLDDRVDGLRQARVGESTKPRILSLGPGRADRTEASGQRVGNLVGAMRDHNPRGIDTTPSAVVGDGSRQDIDELRPALDLVVADEYLAVTGAVNLDGLVVSVGPGGVVIAEK